MEKGSTKRVPLFKEVIIWIFLFPIPIRCFLESCADIGKLGRDGDKCVVLLPNRSFTFPHQLLKDNSESLRPEDCSRYLVHELSDEKFVAWERSDKSKTNVTSFTCTNEECVSSNNALQSMFPDCHGIFTKAWFEYLGDESVGILCLAECQDNQTNEYFLYNQAKSFQIKDPKIKPENVIPNSMFYATNRSMVERAYLFETTVLTYIDVPVLLAVDL